ncbi:hypothetical protein, unlikely [Trypanosoma congolense IL3000]|uniref:Uncharacterized protein n=1 Tax=Trypanosoma congolense (strain IL3000) TaxID=1068625 RepID=F9WA71_TRYCI|nr:hypothetical protein, unlikely [Trypanosoma congolense IL3000]
MKNEEGVFTIEACPFLTFPELLMVTTCIENDIKETYFPKKNNTVSGKTNTRRWYCIPTELYRKTSCITYSDRMTQKQQTWKFMLSLEVNKKKIGIPVINYKLFQEKNATHEESYFSYISFSKCAHHS